MRASHCWSPIFSGPRGRVLVAQAGETADGRPGFSRTGRGNEPDFSTISEFRRSHLKTLEGPFEQFLRLASLKLYRA
jgi:hypothetical protein